MHRRLTGFFSHQFERPIVLLAFGLASLAAGVLALVSLVDAAESWLGYRNGHECEAWWDTNDCWIESSAEVLDVTHKSSRRRPSTTEFVLGIGVDQPRTVEVPGSFEQPTQGSLILARVWSNGDVVAVGDGVSWFETLASPRIALPRSMGFFGAAAGFGMGMFIGGLARRRQAGRWLPPHTNLDKGRYPGKMVTAIVLTPAPAFIATIYWLDQPVWLPLALDAGTAAVVVTWIVFARRKPSAQGNAFPLGTATDRRSPKAERFTLGN